MFIAYIQVMIKKSMLFTHRPYTSGVGCMDAVVVKKTTQKNLPGFF